MYVCIRSEISSWSLFLFFCLDQPRIRRRPEKEKETSRGEKKGKREWKGGRIGIVKGIGDRDGDITNIINFADITDITLHWVRPEPELFFSSSRRGRK